MNELLDIRMNESDNEHDVIIIVFILFVMLFASANIPYHRKQFKQQPIIKLFRSIIVSDSFIRNT